KSNKQPSEPVCLSTEWTFPMIKCYKVVLFPIPIHSDTASVQTIYNYPLTHRKHPLIQINAADKWTLENQSNSQTIHTSITNHRCSAVTKKLTKAHDHNIAQHIMQQR